MTYMMIIIYDDMCDACTVQHEVSYGDCDDISESDFHYYEDIYDAHNDIMLIIYLSKQEKIIVL